MKNLILKGVLPMVVFMIIIFVSFASAQTGTPLREGRDSGLKTHPTSTNQLERDALKARMEVEKDQLKVNHEKLKAEMEAKRLEHKTEFEAKRNEAQMHFDERKMELKGHLAKIKDERKKEIVERLSNRFHELNKKRTDHFSNVLDKLDDVLDRITERMNRAHENGIDVGKVREAVALAEKAIADARALLLIQGGMDYPITVSTEAKLKTDISSVRQTLQTDLKKIHDAVKAAHEAVRHAAQVLKQVDHPGDKNATSSQTQ